MNQIISLLTKDFTLEFRQRSTLNGILLYLLATVFVIYLVFSHIDELNLWIALYWMVLIFATINASFNSFKKESGRGYFYYYQLCSASSIILSKLIFNGVLLVVIALINYFLFTLLFENPIENLSLFFGVLVLGSLALSSTLTMVAAIASKTNNNSTLTAVLSFPILLPSILTAIKASVLCGLGFGWDECSPYILTLGLLNLMIIALSYVLFPYLWRS